MAWVKLKFNREGSFLELLRSGVRNTNNGQQSYWMIATDAALLEQALTGAEDAFTALYRRRQGPVYRFALQMTGSTAVAEDVPQETFLALILHGTRYDECRGQVAG